MLFFFYRYVPTQHTDLYIEQACADPEKLSGEYFFSTGGGGGGGVRGLISGILLLVLNKDSNFMTSQFYDISFKRNWHLLSHL